MEGELEYAFFFRPISFFDPKVKFHFLLKVHWLYTLHKYMLVANTFTLGGYSITSKGLLLEALQKLLQILNMNV